MPTVPGVPGVPETPGAAAGGGLEVGTPAEQGPAQGATGREWTIAPAITGIETFTDNARSTVTNRVADVYTTISPSLFIDGQSSRLKGTFDYAPQAIYYAYATDQDQTLQNLFGNGTLTAVPGLLLFDANASISNQSRAGSRGFANQTQVPTGQNTQTIAYSGSPYVQGHFGDWGDSEVRYRFSQTTFGGNTGATTSAITGQNLGSISNSTQHEGSAQFVTGPRFARLQLTLLADFSDFISGNSFDSSHDEKTVANGSYQVSDSFAALFGGGFEKLTYPQQAPLDFTGPNWNFGARYQPRLDRSLSLTYGQSQGHKSFSGNANYAITSMTTFTASYSVQNSTQQQQALEGLSASTQTAAAPGQLINQSTGLPQNILNPNLALQDAVIRVTTLTAGLQAQLGERNRVSVVVNHTGQLGLGASGINDTSTGGNLSFGRDLSPTTSGSFALGYSTQSSAGQGIVGTVNTTALTSSLGYTFNLTETLSGTASYSLSRESGGLTGTVLIDLVALSLRKTF